MRRRWYQIPLKPLLQVITLIWLQPAWAQVEVLVQLEPAASSNLANTLRTFDGAAKTAARQPLFDEVDAVSEAQGWRANAPVFHLAAADSSAAGRVLSQWQQDPRIAFAQFNHRYRVDDYSETDDPLADSLQHLTIIRARDAWRLTRGSNSVRIGFVDTGVWMEHPDLQDQLWVNPGEDLNGNGRRDDADYNGRDDDNNGLVDDVVGYDFVDRAYSIDPGDYLGRDGWADEDPAFGGGRGHGTTVAGVLAAAGDNGIGITGVAPGVRLVPLRAFGADGQGDDDDIAAAIQYGADLGLDVINLSFGDVHVSPIMQQSIQYAVAKGVVVVASAGNLGGDRPHYPSDYPEVLSVAWLTADGDRLAGRGTHGTGIDLGAPGSSIYTTLFPTRIDETSTEKLYGRRSGSSMAAPMAAGAAALLKALNPSLTPASIHSILVGTAQDLEDSGWDHRTGGGRLDVFQALLDRAPARTEILYPEENKGSMEEKVVVIGSAIHPAFEHGQLFYARGDDGDFQWQPIGQPLAEQVFQDTLGVWDTEGLADGLYTLRLVTTHDFGRTTEARQRFHLDRTAPALFVHLLSDGLVGDRHGIVLDVETDDPTQLDVEIHHQGDVAYVSSDRIARRHGAVWSDRTGIGGRVQVRIRATNPSGKMTTREEVLTVPVFEANASLLTETRLDAPAGYLLTEATDFDRDGLYEIVLNRYENGWIGDSLQVWEWDGSGMRAAAVSIANVIPRSVGDGNRNGLTEVLTQVGGASLVLEQSSLEAFPNTPLFVDTTGLANPFDTNATFGAALTDLDQDGRGELLAHNTQAWRVLEWDGATYAEVTRLENPTTSTFSEVEGNEFQEPEVQVADFDGDGKMDLLVGDADGDWLIYEVAGDNAYRLAWTYETPRYHAGSRLAAGNFLGDERPELITYTQNWTQITSDHEREPDIGWVYVWTAVGDDAYAIVDSLALSGKHTRHGTLATADITGDAYHELVVVNAGQLYVLDRQTGAWRLLYVSGKLGDTSSSGWRSVAVTTHDFTRNGYDDVIAARADGHLWMLGFDGQPAVQPPVWRDAFALDENTVVLNWHVPVADSVTVFFARGDGVFNTLGTIDDTRWIDSTSVPTTYALQAWANGQSSPLSETRFVRPHLPAVIERVDYPTPTQILLAFSEPLEEGLHPRQFTFSDSARYQVESIAYQEPRNYILLGLNRTLTIGQTLTWEQVHDAEQTPVGQTAVQVSPPPAPSPLAVVAWEWLDAHRLRVRFSQPLDWVQSQALSQYTVTPVGRIAGVELADETAHAIDITFANFGFSVEGEEPLLTVQGLVGKSGARMVTEGFAIRLTDVSNGVADLRVFPNPIRLSQGSQRLQIRGVSSGATVRVLTVGGSLVQQFDDINGSGLLWDVRDQQGRTLPSGVYFIHVEHADGAKALRKVAVIR